MSPALLEVTPDERATFRATARQVRNLSDEHITCRAGNHSWRPRNASRIRGGYKRLEFCGNKCGCERYQELDRWGQVLRTNIRYPKGYLLKGIGRLTGMAKGAVRVEAIERIISG
jgi:hypothetical protein